MQRMQCTQCMHTKNATQRIELIACVVFFACMRFVFRFLIASQTMLPLRSIHCVACVAYNNLETACRPMKTDLRSVSMLPYATQWTLLMWHRSKNCNACTQKIQCTQSIELIARVVFFCMHALCISLFDCITSRAWRCVCCASSVALHVLHTTLETVRRPTKTDLKVGFQAAVRNAMDATHAGIQVEYQLRKL